MSASKGSGPLFTWGGAGSSSSSGTSDIKDVSGDYAGTVFGSITVSGAVTASPSVQLEESPDGATLYPNPVCLFSPGTGAGTFPFRFPIDPTARGAGLVFSAGTGGTCTISASLGELQG